VAVSVVPAALGPVAPVIEVQGTVVPDAEVRILPKLTGRLLWAAEEWSVVKAGQDIARIETPELTWQLEQARSGVATARTGLGVARANLQNGRDVLHRVELQFREGAANLAQLDQARNAERIAQAQVEQAQSQIAQAQAGVKVIEAQLQNARIRAPVGGVITQRPLDVGGMASPAQILLVIAHTSRRLVRAAVSERDLRHLISGIRAAVTSVAYPGRVFPGRLVEVGPALDPQTRTVPAKIQLTSGELLKFGMSVEVRLQAPARQALLVPVGSVRRDGGIEIVYEAAVGRARRTVVRTGTRTSVRIEIVSGLRPGTRVIDRGSDLVAGGDRVQVSGEPAQ
jgi:RND family efflux transporter MFP subunit